MKIFKNIFFKLIAAFVLINIVCFAIMSVTITEIITEFGTDMQVQSLYSRSQSFYELEKHGENENNESGAGINIVEKAKNDPEYREVISGNMNFFSEKGTHILFILTDGSGEIITCGGYEKASISDVARESRGKLPLYIPGEAIEKLKNSVPGTVPDVSEEMRGFFRKEMVYSIYPVLENGKLNGTVLAVTVINDKPQKVSSDMNTTVLTSALWIMVTMLIISYFVVHRLISPLREMNKAAKSFANGQFDVRVTVTGDDEIAELATAFNNMASSMQTMEDMRRSFLANLSHELRTPMTTISGFIDGILDGAIPPEKHEYYLGIIATEVRRLSRLVSQLLDISRLEAGERKFEPQFYDICEQGREIIIANIQRLEEKQLDIRFDCDRDNMIVFADKDAVHQVFYNICDNAVKFSKPGGVYEIKITEKDDKVYVSVYNEGKGIAKEDLPNIFERFYKSDKSRSRDKTGMGLGMYIARTVMEVCGEKIWVESEEGKWCRFTFTLPASKQKKVRKDAANG